MSDERGSQRHPRLYALHRGAQLLVAFTVLCAAATAAVRAPHRDEQRPPAAPVALASAEGCSGPLTGTVTFVDTAAGPVALTAGHVLDGAAVLQAGLAADGGPVLGAVRPLPGLDAAALAVPATGAGLPAPVPAGPAALAGDHVTVTGFPGGEPTSTPAVVESVQLRASSWGPAEVLVLDVPTSHGMSGGAVLDTDGEVVGLVVARDHLTHAVIAYRIADVLAALPAGEVRTEKTC